MLKTSFLVFWEYLADKIHNTFIKKNNFVVYNLGVLKDFAQMEYFEVEGIETFEFFEF